MGQHVVHLTRQPLTFGQCGRPGLRLLTAPQLSQQLLGLLVHRVQPVGQQQQPVDTGQRGEHRTLAGYPRGRLQSDERDDHEPSRGGSGEQHGQE
jgi:hypothetical protein